MAMLQTGSFTGWLAASNNACTDSVSFAYTVHGLPQVSISPSTPRICLGDTLALTINTNATLQWNASSTLQATTNGARVWPATETRYRVQAVSQQGCKNSDSVNVQVIQTFKVQVSPDVHICVGTNTTLTASGATAYQWAPAAGLSQPNSANPIANPITTTRYTLTGSDAFGCFTDTASILVTVNPLPQVDPLPNIEVQGGESITIVANANLPNLQWAWTPATYLSCSNCPNPTIRPLNDVVYTVTATTAAGCKSSVSFEVKVLCSKERIYIPNAFTPNGDGLNDRFKLLGGGVSTVRYLRITDRWGKTIFERKMVPFGSTEASWDGNYPNGSAAPSGNYLFVAELECARGETFRFDGGVMLLR
jgi:gliding motility-associated-like protein